MKICIDRAIALYNLKNNTTLTRKDVADRCMPHDLKFTRRIAIKRMAEGESKRPDPKVVWKIAELLETDLNCLYGWEVQK